MNGIDKYIKYILSLGMFESSTEIIENALWFHVSSLVGLTRTWIDIEGKILPLNYYGITIASSSAGKSYSYENIVNMFDFVDSEKYSDVICADFDEINSGMQIVATGTDTLLRNFLPSDFTVNIQGTIEGLYMRVLALDSCSRGSINILNEEILDILDDGLLNSTKEMYDGRFNAKIIKGAINKNIKNIFTNMLVFGSPIAIKKDRKVYDKFNQSLSSGVYRRSFIYFESPRKFKKNKKEEVEKPNADYLFQYLKDSINNNTKDQVISINADSVGFANEIKDKLLEFANSNIDDDRMSAEIGSYDKIIKLGGLYSILTGKSDIDDESLAYAYDFYTRCRETVTELFCTEPQHTRIYKVIQKNDGISKSEILEKDIFDTKTFSQDIQLVEELAYRNNNILVSSGSKIVKYSLEPLPETRLDKIIISIPADGKDKKEKTTEYISYEVPFFGEGRTVENLVTNKNISNFTLCHFKENKNGVCIRNVNNYIEECNCIAFDIDYGMTLEEARKRFEDFTCLIYTTPSHRKDKGGVICDRFRILLPTKTSFKVDALNHKGMYENIAESFDLQIADVSCFNAGRLFFTQEGK
jgi:hypothetical protein